jgi:hypothetical protein
MKPHHRQTLPFIAAMTVAVGCRWFGMDSGVLLSAFAGIFACVTATCRSIAHVFGDTNLWMGDRKTVLCYAVERMQSDVYHSADYACNRSLIRPTAVFASVLRALHCRVRLPTLK